MRPGTDPRTGRPAAIRVGAVAVLLALGACAVVARLVYLQVVARGAYLEQAADQYLRELKLKPRRGDIVDRNGVLLAGSANALSIYADPKVLAQDDRDHAQLRQILALLHLDARTARGLERKLDENARFQWLARRVPPADAAAVQAWLTAHPKYRAVGLFPERRRYYPKAELASQLLGVVDEEGDGREGVELARDEDLQGTAAEIPSLRDGKGRRVLTSPPVPGREREGSRVELTIDNGLQAATEAALARTVSSSHALSGMAVVIDPETGEVLAVATAPRANANAKRTADQIRNRPVTDAFEPGSTIKTYVLAAALEAKVLDPHEAIDCGQGQFTIGKKKIRDHAAVGWVGPAKVLAESSNIGAAKIGSRLGREGLRDWLAAFGFGERTEVGLPGEVRGQLRAARADIELATQSFGQGPITATAVQLTAAMAAIANGGTWVRPHVVRQIIDPATGKVLDAAGPGAARQVVSRETAATITRWLVGVVEDPKGTGHRARLDGWSAAGKTGTAQKADPYGGYSSTRRFSSFVGFAPAESPKVVIGVFIDEPQHEVFGGEVAAPAFREIAEYALRMKGVPPTRPVASAPASPAAPAVLASQAAPGAVPVLASAEAAPEDDAEDEADPVDALAEATREDGRVTVPALTGLPARAAIRHLERLELSAELRGSGRVVGQVPAAGRVVERGTRVRMTLAPAG